MTIGQNFKDIAPGKRVDIPGGFREAINSFHSSVSALRNPRVAVPPLLFLIVHLGILLSYLSSLDPPSSSFWAFFVKGISGSDLGHFPQHIILMQPVLDRVDMFVEIFINIIFQGTIVALIGSNGSGKQISLLDGFRASFGKYLQLLLISILASAVIFIVFYSAGKIRTDLGAVAGNTIYAAGLAVALAIQAMFLYTVPAIILKDLNAFRSLSNSIRIACEAPATAFFLVLIPFILTVPTTFIGIKSALIATRLSPDFIIHNYIVSSVIEMISAYLLIAGGTVVFLRRTKNSFDRPHEYSGRNKALEEE